MHTLCTLVSELEVVANKNMHRSDDVHYFVILKCLKKLDIKCNTRTHITFFLPVA